MTLLYILLVVIHTLTCMEEVELIKVDRNDENFVTGDCQSREAQ